MKLSDYSNSFLVYMFKTRLFKIILRLRSEMLIFEICGIKFEHSREYFKIFKALKYFIKLRNSCILYNRIPLSQTFYQKDSLSGLSKPISVINLSDE